MPFIALLLRSSLKKKTKSIQLTMITSFGVAKGKHSGIVQSQVTLDDLFASWLYQFFVIFPRICPTGICSVDFDDCLGRLQGCPDYIGHEVLCHRIFLLFEMFCCLIRKRYGLLTGVMGYPLLVEKAPLWLRHLLFASGTKLVLNYHKS